MTTLKQNISATSSHKRKLSILVGISVACVLFLAWFGPIPQDISYHNFVDQRKIMGLDNFWNVVSNLPFIIVGVIGMYVCRKKQKDNYLYNQVLCFFAGVFLTGFGSVYYHLNPDNQSLVWDRLPMTIVFMAFSSFIIEEYIKRGWGRKMLPFLLLFGIGSVAYWAVTEEMGQGDLRFYVLVQFLPILLFPITISLFESKHFKRKAMLAFASFYLLAKVCEYFDKGIYETGYMISGHSLKHILAAMGIYWFLIMLSCRTIFHQALWGVVCQSSRLRV